MLIAFVQLISYTNLLCSFHHITVISHKVKWYEVLRFLVTYVVLCKKTKRKEKDEHELCWKYSIYDIIVRYVQFL